MEYYHSMRTGKLGTAGRTHGRNELKPAPELSDKAILAAAQRDLERTLIERWRRGEPALVGTRTTSFVSQRHRQEAPT